MAFPRFFARRVFARRVFRAGLFALLAALSLSPAAQALPMELRLVITGPLDGDIDGVPFTVPGLTIIGGGDTDNVLGLLGVELMPLDIVTVDAGPAGAIGLLDPVFVGLFAPAGSLTLTLGATSDTFAGALAPGPLAWSLTAPLAPTPVTVTLIDWTAFAPDLLHTTGGQLRLNFPVGADLALPGVLSAMVADVPSPAAGALLLGALGILGVARRRARQPAAPLKRGRGRSWRGARAAAISTADAADQGG